MPIRPPLAAKAFKTSSEIPTPDTALSVSWLATTGARLAAMKLHMHGFGSVRDVDQNSKPVHCGNEFAPALVDPMKVVPRLAALDWRQFAVGEGIEARMRGELNRAQA